MRDDKTRLLACNREPKRRRGQEPRKDHWCRIWCRTDIKLEFKLRICFAVSQSLARMRYVISPHYGRGHSARGGASVCAEWENATCQA